MRTSLQRRDSEAIIRFKGVPLDSSSNKTPRTPDNVKSVSHADTKASVPSLGRVTIHEEDSDSDDSLEGYASSSHSSSRASSPARLVSKSDAKNTASRTSGSNLRPTIEEINADPTLLNPLQKRIQRPVYLLDLGRLLKGDKEGNEQLESLQVALDTAASLIRKKASWGLELGRNPQLDIYTC